MELINYGLGIDYFKERVFFIWWIYMDIDLGLVFLVFFFIFNKKDWKDIKN